MIEFLDISPSQGFSRTMTSPFIHNDESHELFRKRVVRLSKYIQKNLATLVAEYSAPCMDELKEIITFQPDAGQKFLEYPILFGDFIAHPRFGIVTVWLALGREPQHVYLIDMPRVFERFGSPVARGKMLSYISAGDALIVYAAAMIIVWTFDNGVATGTFLTISQNYKIVRLNCICIKSAPLGTDYDDADYDDVENTNAPPPIHYRSISKMRALVSDSAAIVTQMGPHLIVWNSKTFDTTWRATLPFGAIAMSSFRELPAECVRDDCEAGDVALLCLCADPNYQDYPLIMFNVRSGEPIDYPAPFGFGYRIVTALAKPRGVLFHGRRGPSIWDQDRREHLTISSQIIKKRARKSYHTHLPYSYTPQKDGRISIEVTEAKPSKNKLICIKWLRKLAPMIHPATLSFERTLDGEFITSRWSPQLQTPYTNQLVSAATGRDRIEIAALRLVDKGYCPVLGVRRFATQDRDTGAITIYG